MRTSLFLSLIFLILFSMHTTVILSREGDGIATYHEQADESVKTKDVIHFAATSDQHYGGIFSLIYPEYDDDTIHDWNYSQDLPDLDFVVASFGDWISKGNTEDNWRKITENNADNQGLPYFFVFGNHDISGSIASEPGNPVARERIGRRISGLNENNYAFMYNNVLFISVAQTNVLYHLSQFQRDWVEYLVERYQDHTTVLWSHQATYETTGKRDARATSWNTNDYRVHNDVVWWRSLLEGNPQIKMYIHGHTEKGADTAVLDLHQASWDDDCTFVLVPSNKDSYLQGPWSYIFKITDRFIEVKLWDSSSHAFKSDSWAGVPYLRKGSFNVKSTGMEWFSIPKRVLDGQKWTWNNRMIAKGYELELIGTNVTEQIDNPDLKGCHEGDEDSGAAMGGYWYAVRGDENALNTDTGEEDGYLLINGGNTVRLATSGPLTAFPWIEGKVPYNTATAVSGKTYEFKATMKTEGGTGTADFLITIPEELNVNNKIWTNVVILDDVNVLDYYQTFTARFTLPGDDNMWFIQPIIEFHDPSVTYNWDSWSLEMAPTGTATEDFGIKINNVDFKSQGVLLHHQYAKHKVAGNIMLNDLEIEASIQGNRVGMLRFIYEEPQLWSDDVTLGILDNVQTMVNIEDISPFNMHTTIMSFEGAEFGIDGPGFYDELIRNKPVYRNALNDKAINGIYVISRL